jgi:phytoene dehydrogenase-like protein
MRSFDAIVVGGGTNGLAAAGRLARAGRAVLVLEAADTLGGGAVTREFAPGYRVSAVAHLLNMLDPRVAAGLDLARHGLQLAAANIATTAVSADGDHLVLEGAYGERLRGSISDVDRAAWADLRARLLRQAGVLRPVRATIPPRPARGVGNDLAAVARLGLRVRGLGRDELREFLRMLLINVADVLDDELGDDRLKGLVAFDTILGARLGPRSPNSLILLLNRLAGEAGGLPAALAVPRGGMGAVADAMATAVASLGVTLRTGARVRSFEVTGDRVTGATLDTGETFRASQVLSAINPRTTFLDLLGPRHLDTGFVRRTQAIRMRGTAAKLHLALSAAPDFRGAGLRTRLVVAPSIDAVETAFNPVKYGGFSDSPVMEILLPTVFEDGLAPPGHHVLSAIVQFAPHEAKGGWEAARPRFLERIMAVLEGHAPGIGKLVTATELLTPADLAERYGFVGGDWHHGEFAVERMLFLRPAIGAAQYAAPVPGLWLAGAGSHPGGGISGAAGWNAAERLLATEPRA